MKRLIQKIMLWYYYRFPKKKKKKYLGFIKLIFYICI